MVAETLHDIVNIETTIAQPTITADFGGALFVTNDAGSQENQFESYVDLAAVGENWLATSAPYLAARAYFSNTPRPQPLVVGKWVTTSTNDRLVGGNTPDAPTQIALALGPRTISSGSDISALPSNLQTQANLQALSLNINGDEVSLGSAAWASPAIGNLAAALTTAINADADFTGWAVAYTSNRFVLTAPSGAPPTGAVIQSVTGDLAEALEWDTASNPVYGTATVTDGLNYGSATTQPSVALPTVAPTGPAIAAVVQTAIQAAVIPGVTNSAWTVVFENGRYELNAAGGDDLDYFTGALATALGWTSGVADIEQGITGQPQASDFYNSAKDSGQSFYWVVPENDIADTQLGTDLATAVDDNANSANKHYIADSAEGNLIGNGVAGEGRDVANLRSDRVTLIYSATRDYKAAALAGYFAARNLSEGDQLPTAKFKRLGSTAVDRLTRAQMEAADGLNVNYYVTVGVPATFWLRAGRPVARGLTSVSGWTGLCKRCKAMSTLCWLGRTVWR